MGYVTELPAHTRVLYEMILFSGVLNLNLDFNSTDFDNRLLSTCQGPGPELCAGGHRNEKAQRGARRAEPGWGQRRQTREPLGQPAGLTPRRPRAQCPRSPGSWELTVPGTEDGPQGGGQRGCPPGGRAD